MLSTQSLPLIEATLPLVGERIQAIAKNFYSRMFGAHPELFDVHKAVHERHSTRRNEYAVDVGADLRVTNEGVHACS
jgi:hemoglobin-like flavoprotein